MYAVPSTPELPVRGTSNAVDVLLALDNQTHLLDALKLISVLGVNDKARMTSDEEGGSLLPSWVYGFEQGGGNGRASKKTGSAEEKEFFWSGLFG